MERGIRSQSDFPVAIFSDLSQYPLPPMGYCSVFLKTFWLLLVTHVVSFGQSTKEVVKVDYDVVNKVTIDHYENLIKGGDWNNGLAYFDAHSPPTDDDSNPKLPKDKDDAIAWERYLFTASDVHLRRALMFNKTEAIVPHAKKAEDGCLSYIAWYSSLKSSPAGGAAPESSSEEPLGWLPEVKAKSGQNDPPLTRGRIRHVLSQLVESILTQRDPKRAAEALKGYDELWFGGDAIRKWIKALGYRFSDRVPAGSSDFERIRENLKRDGWRDHVSAFVEKLDAIEKKRNEIKAPVLEKEFIDLREQLRALPPMAVPQ